LYRFNSKRKKNKKQVLSTFFFAQETGIQAARKEPASEEKSTPAILKRQETPPE
jgi:hypothetical protein